MGRLIVSAQMTMDCVMDQLEGWFDPEGEAGVHGLEQLRAADAVILGRETYEQLAKYWPAADGPYADLINPIPKFVASPTPLPQAPSTQPSDFLYVNDGDTLDGAGGGSGFDWCYVDAEIEAANTCDRVVVR